MKWGEEALDVKIESLFFFVLSFLGSEIEGGKFIWIFQYLANHKITLSQKKE